MNGRTTDQAADVSGYTRPVPDEYDTRLRSLMAERQRPVPPPRKNAPSALSRYMRLAEVAAEIGDDLTVESLYDSLPGGAA